MPEPFNKKDLEIILEVNKKAIEIDAAVVDQNEEIIELLNICKDHQEEMGNKIDKLLSQNEETSKDLFRIRILFIAGILAIVGQIVEIFLKK